MFEKTMLTGGSRRWFRPPVTRLAINGASRKLQTDCAFSSTCGSNIPRALRWTRDRRVGSPTSVDAGAGRDGAQPSTLSYGIGRSLAACLRLIDRDSRLRSSIGRVTAAAFSTFRAAPPEWKKQAADREQLRMLKRGMLLEVIDWSEDQATLPFKR